MKEVWKAVTGYKNYYEVSNLGNVRSVTRTMERIHWGTISKYTKLGVPLNPYMHTKGYQKVDLTKDGEKNKLYVHRLVALAFIENAKNKPQVNHKNGIKTDNNVDNLEWVTNTENRQHAIEAGLFNKHKEVEVQT